MKKTLKTGLLAIAVSFAITACNRPGQDQGTTGDSVSNESTDGSDTSALDSFNTDTLGTTGNDRVQ